VIAALKRCATKKLGQIESGFLFGVGFLFGLGVFIVVGSFHGLFEIADAFAESFAEVGKLAGTEEKQGDADE
jgi:hypothetical protein